MFDKEHKPKELNKIMGTIANKQEVLFNDNEDANNVWLKDKIYQQINLIKL